MLTAAEIRSEPHLSVSQLSSWLMCPRKWRFQYLDKLPWPTVPASLVFGSAIHGALGAFHEARLEGQTADLDELIAAFQEIWQAETKPIQMKPSETAEGFVELAQRLLSLFLEEVQPAEVLAVEEAFRIRVADGLPPLIGFIDLIERRGDRVVIVEYKTAAQRFSAQRVHDDLQISAYAMAGLEMDLPGVKGLDDLDLEFHVLLKTKTPVVDRRPAPRTASQLKEFKETAVDIYRAIEAGVFPRNRGWQCSGCPFRQECST